MCCTNFCCTVQAVALGLTTWDTSGKARLTFLANQSLNKSLSQTFITLCPSCWVLLYNWSPDFDRRLEV